MEVENDISEMNREKEISKVTVIGGVANLILLAFKFIAGVCGNSAAMLADAVHSLSDFATDVIVLVFVRISGKPKDKGHDYGHGKYETLATTIIGIALLAVAIGLFYHGAIKIYSAIQGETLQSPGMLAFWAAIASIAVKELIYRYTIAKARKLDSPAMEANAWHHRSDALSSIGTAIGIGGAILLGQKWAILDPIASLVVSVFIIKVALELMGEGLGDLLERSLPDEVENEIVAIVNSVPGVTAPHDLHTRRIGRFYAIEMHVFMDGSTPLSIAHEKADRIENLISQRFGHETHISIHMEPDSHHGLEQ